MTVAALLVFGSLLVAWLAAPAEHRHRARVAARPLPELPGEARAA